MALALFIFGLIKKVLSWEFIIEVHWRWFFTIMSDDWFVFWLHRHCGAKQISKVVNCGQLSRKISCSIISRVHFSGSTLIVNICFEFSACQSVLSVLSPAYHLILTRSIISMLHPNKYHSPPHFTDEYTEEGKS